MFKKRIKKNNLIIKSTNGFAILFAVLTASLLMSIGISIFGISIKELSLSTASKDSQIAFYAADSARECAQYWDTKVGAFKTYIDGHESTNNPSITSIVCNGNTIDISSQQGTYPTYSFSLPPQGTISPAFFNYSSITSPNTLSPEAGLTIIKKYVTAGNYIDTIISAYGHNVSINAGRRIERGVRQEIINN